MVDIPDYEMVEQLGQGASGDVYLARERAGGTLVAIKVLMQQKQENPTLLARFKREIRATLQMDHPNLIRGHTAGIADERWYYVMEYVPGKTVAEAVDERGQFDEAEAFGIALRVAEALAYAGTFDLVHRDIKPDNIILGDNGEVKLVDMGLAKTLASENPLTLQGSLIGTPQYMSPEQANADEVDLRSDIYSLGATLYTMLTGQSPVPDSKNPMKVIRALLSGPPTPIAELRPDLTPEGLQLMQKMMAVSPDDRHPHHDALVADLRRITGSEAPAATTAVPTDFGPCAPPSADDVLVGLTLAASEAIDARQLSAALDEQERAALIGARLPLLDVLALDAAARERLHRQQLDSARELFVECAEGLVDPLAMAQLSSGDASPEQLVADGLLDAEAHARVLAAVRGTLDADERRATGAAMLSRGWAGRSEVDAAAHPADLLPAAQRDALLRAVRRNALTGAPIEELLRERSLGG